MTVSALFFFHVLRAREWRYGPDFPEFLEQHQGRDRVDVLRAALQEALVSTEANRPHMDAKVGDFRRGYRVLVVAILALAGSLIATWVG